MSNLQQVENPRRHLAKILADYYSGELGGAVEKPAPKFAMQRVFSEMLTPRGLHDGYEKEICGSAALIAGGRHDPHRVIIPWGVFGQRAASPMIVGSDSVGGYLRGVENLPAQGALYPWSVVIRGGITLLENLTANVTIPVETATPTGAWLPTETTAIVDSQPTLAQAAMTPRTFGAVVAFSRLLLLQAPGIENFLRDQLLRVAGRALDQAVLVGGGAEEPVGIVNTPSLPSESGTSFAWANACNMLDTLTTAGLDDTKVTFVAGPDARKTLQGRAVSTSGPWFIWDGDSVCGRKAFATADMTTGLMLAGDFSRAILDLWGPGVELTINPYQDFVKGVVAARVFVSADVAVPQIGAFVKTTTIT